MAKHGHTCGGKWSRTYRIYHNMIQRCTNPNNPKWAQYGKRGIYVDPHWRADFRTFLADMGPVPDGHSIERINNNEGYTKDNCRWATPSEQSKNKRNNRIIRFNGESLCTTEWAERTGLSESVIRNRLNHGWPIDKTLTTPVAPYPGPRFLTYEGTTLSVSGWARRLELSYQAIIYRLDHAGWTIAEALTTPTRLQHKTT